MFLRFLVGFGGVCINGVWWDTVLERLIILGRSVLLNRFVFPLVAIVAFNPVGVFAQSVTPASKPAPPAVTKVLPSSMAGVVLFNTTKDNWGKFNRFNPFPFDVSGPTFLPFLPAGIDYQTNVQPWIGDWAGE